MFPWPRTRPFSWSKMSSSLLQRETSTLETPFGSASLQRRASMSRLYHWGRTEEERWCFHLPLISSFVFVPYSHCWFGPFTSGFFEYERWSSSSLKWPLYCGFNWRADFSIFLYPFKVYIHLKVMRFSCFPVIPSTFLLLSHPCTCGVAAGFWISSPVLRNHLFTHPCIASVSVWIFVLCFSFYILNKCKELKNLMCLVFSCVHTQFEMFVLITLTCSNQKPMIPTLVKLVKRCTLTLIWFSRQGHFR